MSSHVEVEVLHTRCAGLDISKRDTKVTIRVFPKGARRAVLTRLVFGASAAEVAKLRQRLVKEEVTCVVMEATSSYWKPFYYGLEGASWDLMLVNPKHVKTLRGRKTDRLDADFLSKIGALGMAKPSFVPGGQIRALRQLTRERTRLVGQRTRQVNHLEKVLEDTCLKLTAVSSKTLNQSTRAILDAICRGETDPVVLAKLGSRLKATPEVLHQALVGRVEPFHVEAISLSLRLVDQLDVEITHLEGLIDQYAQPVETEVDLLCTIPGVSKTIAVGMLAEMGPDMSVFWSAKHLASWAGVAPGANQSAGINRSTKCPRGNKHLKRVLGMAACAAVSGNTPESFLRARYRRLVRRGGKKQAQVAVMRSMVMAIYHMLSNGCTYRDLGAEYYGARDRQRTIEWHQARLVALQAA